MRTLLAFTILFCVVTSAHAAEYARYAQDSTTICLDRCIPADEEDTRVNARRLNIGGVDIDLETINGDAIPPSFALAPFQFHPRDFSLTEVNSIDSISLGIRNAPSLDTDDGAIEVFYVPDSREDFGVALTRDEEDIKPNCDFNNPQECYELTYDAGQPGGINPSQFSAAPVSLGMIELLGSDIYEDQTTIELNPSDAVKSSMIDRINSGQGFHLVFGATEADKYIEVGSFDTNRSEGPGSDARPQLVIDASGIAGGVTKDLLRHGSIHVDGDAQNNDFYGSGNDDNFSEFGIANFQFSKDDLGVTDDVETIGAVSLTLTHSERNFADGDMLEFFFTSDTADSLGYTDVSGYQNLTYDADEENGIDSDQFSDAPISLGEYEYVERAGGTPDTFDLNLSEDAETKLIEAINSGDDFHLIIAVPDPEFDVTFSGFESGWDPGNPQLTISLEEVDEGLPLDLNSDGAVTSDDAALLCEQEDYTDRLTAGGILRGDANFSGEVDFADFLILSTNFGQNGHFGQGDFNCDGSVVFSDFLILSTNFGSAAAVAAPEPSCGTLAFFGLVVIALARKRRK